MVVALLEADEDDRDLTEEHSSSETAIDGLVRNFDLGEEEEEEEETC